MFDAKIGFFHLVFANLKDDYYSDSYVRMGFSSYLKMSLLNDNFRYICFVDRSSVMDSKGEYRMELSGNLTEQILKEKNEKSEKKGFKPFWGPKKPAQDDTAELTYESKTTINADKETLCRLLQNYLDRMGKLTGCALVIPIDIFVLCCDDPDTLEAFISRQDSQHKLNTNIVILTGSVNAEDHDAYFSGLTNAVVSDRRSKELFPNITRYIKSKCNRDDHPVLPNLIFSYDFLQEAFGERMQVLNDLSFDKLCILTRYALLRAQGQKADYPFDCYAAVIYAWYANHKFRQKYSALPLPENPFCLLCEITGAIHKPGFIDAANRVLDAETGRELYSDTARSIADHWRRDRQWVNILYSEKFAAKRLPGVCETIKAYRRMLRGHETSILIEEELRKLDHMLAYFSRPSYSLEKQHTLQHTRFADSGNDKTVQELYLSLRKRTWNRWDETAMKLLYILFCLCYRNSMECSPDWYDQMLLEQYEFECAISWIKECIRQSKENPENSSEADYHYHELKDVLFSRDINRLKLKKAQTKGGIFKW